jgi:hypothetical protein
VPALSHLVEQLDVSRSQAAANVESRSANVPSARIQALLSTSKAEDHLQQRSLMVQRSFHYTPSRRSRLSGEGWTAGPDAVLIVPSAQLAPIGAVRRLRTQRLTIIFPIDLRTIGQHSLPSAAGGPQTTVIAATAGASSELSNRISASANRIGYDFFIIYFLWP